MRVLPTLALLGVTAAWGSTFFMIKDLLHEVSVLDFLAVRFAIAAVVLWAIAPRSVMRLSRDELRHGVVLGLLYGVAQVMQTTGLERTPATVSGFVTGMYVVATPIFAAVLLHERITRTIWVAVVIATIGLGFLSLSGFAVSRIRTSLVSQLAAVITTKRRLPVRPTETENCRSFSS